MPITLAHAICPNALGAILKLAWALSKISNPTNAIGNIGAAAATRSLHGVIGRLRKTKTYQTPESARYTVSTR